MDAHPDLIWLREEIALGLSKCVVLRLPGCPPEDAIVHVAEIWLEAILDAPICWVENLDRIRIRRGFVVLTRICQHWPTPSTLLAHLPDREIRALPEVPISEESLAKNRTLIRWLINDLKEKLGRQVSVN